MAKDTKKVKEKKDKKESKTFFKDFKAELKKVTWPTPKQLATKTTAVIVIVIIIAAIVFALDFAFDKSYEFLITKASNSINKDKNNEITNENSDSSDADLNLEDVGNLTDSTDTADATVDTAETPAQSTEEAPAE